MRYFLDTEFYEEPGTIDLISIGIVSENGRELYAENCCFDWNRQDRDMSWLKRNVHPHLGGPLLYPASIRYEILKFVADDPAPEFWAWYADYDWVAFCWLFGRMIDLPAQFPKFCRDLKQVVGDRKIPVAPPAAAHNALADARWNRSAWEWARRAGYPVLG